MLVHCCEFIYPLCSAAFPNTRIDKMKPEERYEKWYYEKTERMVEILGEEYDQVMHALFPYDVGGALDLYYFPYDIEGTGIATKELSGAPGEGPSNEIFGDYELVMFTRQTIDLDAIQDVNSDFGSIHKSISFILNRTARYSEIETINSKETCEIPPRDDQSESTFIILDDYKNDREQPFFGLLLVMQIFRSEMEYARLHGGRDLIDKLKRAKAYPYSDLNRPALA